MYLQRADRKFSRCLVILWIEFWFDLELYRHQKMLISSSL